MKARKIQASDVIHAATQFTDREDCIDELRCRINALETLLEKMISRMPSTEQFSLLIDIGGRNANEVYEDGQYVEIEP